MVKTFSLYNKLYLKLLYYTGNCLNWNFGHSECNGYKMPSHATALQRNEISLKHRSAENEIGVDQNKSVKETICAKRIKTE